MKLRIFESTSKSSWNTYIATHSPGALFQTWEWGEVQDRIDVPIHRFTYMQGHAVVGMSQVITVRAKRGSFIHVRHGPVIKDNDLEVFRQVIHELLEYAKKERVWFVRVSPLVLHNSPYASVMQEYGGMSSAIHQMDGEVAWVLDLSPSTETLLSSMRKTTRYEIKRSFNMDIRIDSSGNQNAIDAFIHLYNQTAKRQGFVEHKGIKEELDIFLQQKMATLYLGYVRDELISGAVILFSNNQAIYHHGASIPSKIPVSYRIQWEAIQDAKQKGLSIYNFWGISLPDAVNHPWKGLTLFKQGFGGRMVEYLHAYDIPVSPLYRVTRAVDMVRKIRKGYT